jgi:hypothetical protein
MLNAEAVAFEQPRAAGEAARYMALVRGR